MEKLRKLHAGSFGVSLVVVIIGVMLIAMRSSLLEYMTQAIGIAAVVAGIIQLVSSLSADSKNPVEITISAVIIAFGVWLIVFPGPVANFIPIVLGVLMVAHGTTTIAAAWRAKKMDVQNWAALLLLGAISTIAGVIAICCARFLNDVLLIIIGIIFLYDGISSMVVQFFVVQAEKNVVDVDYQEEDGENVTIFPEDLDEEPRRGGDK